MQPEHLLLDGFGGGDDFGGSGYSDKAVGVSALDMAETEEAQLVHAIALSMEGQAIQTSRCQQGGLQHGGLEGWH